MAIEQTRVSNALGVPVPQWIIDQLDRRSTELSRVTRDTDNIRYQGNRTAWIRMISSIDIVKPSTQQYFAQNMGLTIKDESSLAKLFILQGGVSIYENSEVNGSTQFQYKQRNGFPESYNVAGTNETLAYGYRPMPGITNVRVQTQGKLGSIRSADIQLKVWDKSQLDIIDALYFKLGFTMFLEWGHTHYYDNDGTLRDSELYSIDPFAQDLTKEIIYNQISNNINKTKGNYDAILGIVTNFNFTYNQEGGYDCTIKLQALGSLISSMKMNNPRILPDLSAAIVKKLVDTIVKEAQRQQALENAKNQTGNSTDTTITTTTIKPTLAIDYYKQYLYDSKKNQYTIPSSVFYNYPSSQNFSFPENANFETITPRYSRILFIKKLNGFLVFSRSDQNIKIDSQFLNNTLSKNKINLAADNNWNEDTISLAEFQILLGTAGFLASGARLATLTPKTTANIEYTGVNLRKYNITISREIYGYVDKNFGKDIEVKANERFIPISNQQFAAKALNFLGNEQGNDYKYTLTTLPGENNYNNLKFTISGHTYIDVAIPIEQTSGVGAGQTKVEQKTISTKAKLEFTISFTDTDLIKSFKNPSDIQQPSDFKSYEEQTKNPEPPKVDAPPPVKPEPALKVSDIQTSEALKYQSAFEVMVRTLQLYSLDTALNANIDTNKKVLSLDLTEKSKDGKDGTYPSFTKNLFSVGIFSNMLDDLVKDDYNLEALCKTYDEEVQKTGTTSNMLKLRAIFGFHFGLMGNVTTATDLYKNNCKVDYKTLLKTYIVPYEFNSGIFEGTQVNHPVYISLGLVVMILNHVCGIYEASGKATFTTPLVYVDYNNITNLCMSNAKHLSTNPYDILIPFQGTNKDYESIIDPTVLRNGKNGNVEIMPASGSSEPTPLFSIKDKSGDRISAGLLEFKLVTSENIETFRGRTMNILLSCDYLLKVVSSYSKNNGSGDIYFKEFLEQILFDINKSLGDINLFRLAYNDAGNTSHIVDDQIIPYLEKEYITSNINKSRFPLYASGSIARNLEIRTEISNKLNNTLAVSANSNLENQSTLSKNGDSLGIYNLSYKDRYIPYRGELTGSIQLPTNTMIESAIQFNKAIETFYSEAKPAESSVSHATNYYIQRMSKIKGEERGTRAAAMIPVNLNFSIDGISGIGMGHAFTISEQLLPYSYDLRNVNPFGEQDNLNTVGFVMVGLDQVIENNQWISNVRSSMVYLKKRQDFESEIIKKLEQSNLGLENTEKELDMSNFTSVSIAATKLNYTAEQIKNTIKKKGYTWYESDFKMNIVGVRNSSTKNFVTDKYDDLITVTYKEGSEIKFYQWAITTDPGAYYVKNFFEGTTSTGIMAPGQYINAYSTGMHRNKYEALVEVGPIKAFRDNNKDNVYDETNIQQGNFNMNIHRSSETGVSTIINDSSAGCQVFASDQDFNNFMILVKSSKAKLNSNSFTYTLLTSNDIT